MNIMNPMALVIEQQIQNVEAWIVELLNQPEVDYDELDRLEATIKTWYKAEQDNRILVRA
jgi:hypothetical protein